MKIKNTILVLVLAVLAFTPAAFAQTATTKTTLNGALAGGAQNNIVTLLSVTGITASTTSQQTFIFVDDELMEVRAVNSTLSTVTVRRAARGRAVPHFSGAIAWYGGPATFDPSTGNVGGGPGNPTVGSATATPAVFVGSDPVGRCTRASNTYLPVINPNTGDFFDCILQTTATTNQWVKLNAKPSGHFAPYKKLAVTATTYTALPNDEIIGVNTSVAATITIPALTGWIGKVYRIQQEITGYQSITVATSSGQLINGATTVAFPNGAYATTLYYHGIYIYSDGQNWFATMGN